MLTKASAREQMERHLQDFPHDTDTREVLADHLEDEHGPDHPDVMAQRRAAAQYKEWGPVDVLHPNDEESAVYQHWDNHYVYDPQYHHVDPDEASDIISSFRTDYDEGDGDQLPQYRVSSGGGRFGKADDWEDVPQQFYVAWHEHPEGGEEQWARDVSLADLRQRVAYHSRPGGSLPGSVRIYSEDGREVPSSYLDPRDHG